MKAKTRKIEDSDLSGPLLSYYKALTDAGKIVWDEKQLPALVTFQHLSEALTRMSTKTSFLSLLKKGTVPVKGLYLWGDVGRGKSFLMDLFYNSVQDLSKRRVHFHGFMQEVHYTLHSQGDREKGLPKLAKDIAHRSRLLCFDEFQVTNIADAMIMKRLFEALFQEGVVIVATSNTPPQDLYLKGLHRDRFLPFIDELLDHVEVLELDGEEDYRRSRIEGEKRYFIPLTQATEAKLHDIWEQLTEQEESEELDVRAHGRTLTIPRYAKGAAWFSFHELCGLPLGATDYLALAENISILILDGITKLTPEGQDEAHRLQTLVDVLYDQGVLLIASAQVPPDEIYVKGKGDVAFKRTASRLIEMCHA